MSYLIKMTALGLLMTLSVTSYAQTLKSAVNSEALSKAKILNAETEKGNKKIFDDMQDDAYKYKLTYQDITMKDVDADGIKDAVTLLYYCEITNCHPTTRTVDLVVFKGNKKNQFTKLGSAPLGVHGKLKDINNGIINVSAFYYKAEDASCCPSSEYSRSYAIKNNKLFKVQ